MATQTAVKERPILFSGPMVRAILDGRKTVTRRVVTDPPTTLLPKSQTEWRLNGDVHLLWGGVIGADYELLSEHRCPYGEPGDRLWVRETFRETFDIDDQPVMEYRAGGTRLINGKSICHGQHRITSVLPKWRPSIFLPRWASRLTLEVVSVRVERLREMTEEDAVAEGFYLDGCGGEGPVLTFKRLWDKLNARRGFSWESNPFVWRVEFKRL